MQRRVKAFSAYWRIQRMRPGETGNGSGNLEGGDFDDEQIELPPEFLSQAALGWVRRGYRVRYSDAYLIQLIRRGRPARESVPFIVLALLGFAGAAAALAIALSRRPWHVVMLARGPDEQVLTHEQWSTHPPEA